MSNSPTPYFISLQLRQIVLRIIVISSLSSFLINVTLGGEQLFQHDNEEGSVLMALSIIPLSISLHHILSQLIVDFQKAVAKEELVGQVRLDIFDHRVRSRILMCIFALVVLWLSVGASFGFMIWNLRASQYRTIGCTYEFIDSGASSISRRNSRHGRWSLLFGENTVKRRFGVDRRIIRGIRAVISILCLLAMITLVFFVLVVQPMQKQLYLQTLWAGQYSDDPDVNVTMRVAMALDYARMVEETRPDNRLDFFDVDIKWRPESLHGAQEILLLGYLMSVYIPTALVIFRLTNLRARQYDRHLVANVHAIIPDPEATSSSHLDNTTATLRLTYAGGFPLQTEYKIEREQSSNSVFSGFALLGGAWTFINGIKPLSIYGLVHLFQRRRSLVDGGYTLSAEEQSRTVAVLREHLLDDNNDTEGGEASEEKDQDGEQSILREIV
ncbi:hypothetical protein AGABI1DRAFT_108449 [Agaricus bisporus var. burnettii JB137-S8]|uniref:Uncharacterized protein n=1 Tax=Agaricus bisporus var. burnettii (strain JB137-S8 / ATCC MYA-4627 / FGSC 10392) TaxID=597362 RepID=K5X1V4_AGABU|nr:uncharacterized protein AGABI1DRAFT_108449 [Agaricus bisporus var. burnettii JB137-S8]EKM77093.1 hypothetical protein AGABI1DRAFT_108449 [Agaricus bisporus var. burnettii JB137-S8]